MCLRSITGEARRRHPRRLGGLLLVLVLLVSCSGRSSHATNRTRSSTTTGPAPSVPVETTVAGHASVPQTLLKANGPTCRATVTNPHPPLNGTESVNVVSNVANTDVTVTVQASPKANSYQGKTDVNGAAAVSFAMQDVNRGFPAIVSVALGAARCETTFTPA
jgi:hypothetical protein